MPERFCGRADAEQRVQVLGQPSGGKVLLTLGQEGAAAYTGMSKDQPCSFCTEPLLLCSPAVSSQQTAVMGPLQTSLCVDFCKLWQPAQRLQSSCPAVSSLTVQQ